MTPVNKVQVMFYFGNDIYYNIHLSMSFHFEEYMDLSQVLFSQTRRHLFN